ncbi:MAG: hypothetical protein ACFCU3_01860 [Verrucomicrobiales bacterium]
MNHQIFSVSSESGLTEMRQRVVEFLDSTSSGAVPQRAPSAGESFEELALDLFQWQTRQNPSYHRYCRSLGIDGRPDSWLEIPALPQALFKEAELTSVPELPIRYRFETSGTTSGKPGVHLLPELDLYRRAVLSGWRYFKLPVLPRHSLIPRAATHPQSSLSWMLEFLRELAPPQTWFVGEKGEPDFTGLTLFLKEAYTPFMVLGTHKAFEAWLEWGEAKGMKPFAFGSVVWETGGMKALGMAPDPEPWLRRLEETLDVPPGRVINEYGMTELASQCYATGDDGKHRAPPWLGVRVVDVIRGTPVEIGEVGLVELVDLANVYTVLAIQTQDLAEWHGDSFRLVGRAGGEARGCSLSTAELLKS